MKIEPVEVSCPKCDARYISPPLGRYRCLRCGHEWENCRRTVATKPLIEHGWEHYKKAFKNFEEQDAGTQLDLKAAFYSGAAVVLLECTNSGTVPAMLQVLRDGGKEIKAFSEEGFPRGVEQVRAQKMKDKGVN